jgi:hypothetical protein
VNVGEEEAVAGLFGTRLKDLGHQRVLPIGREVDEEPPGVPVGQDRRFEQHPRPLSVGTGDAEAVELAAVLP